MQRILAIVVAIPCLLFGVYVLWAINEGTYEHIKTNSLSDVFEDIISSRWNFGFFVGSWVIGLASLVSGLFLIHSATDRETA